MTTTDYVNLFSPKAYFEIYYDDPKKLDTYILEKQNDFWSQVVKDNVGSLLEYGAGPTISRLISSSHHVQNIIAAEYLEANRKALQDWITEDPKAFNWRPSFEHVVQTLEGKSPEEVEKREAEVREKIKAIIPCDIKSPNRLEIPRNISAKYGPLFDVVSTCLCIEPVVESVKEYKDVVAFLSKMARPGGYLVMIGVLGCTFYTVGEVKFHCFPLTKAMVLDAMKEAGMKDVVFDCTDGAFFNDFEREVHESNLFDRSGYFFVYGRA